MKRTLLAAAVLVSFALPSLAVDSQKAAYMGGSLTTYQAKTEGKVTTSGDALVWTPEKGDVDHLPATGPDPCSSAQCAATATTMKGTRCSRRAKAGSAYCWQHGG